MSYERWTKEVVRELIEQGAYAGITATEWMAHHYNAE